MSFSSGGPPFPRKGQNPNQDLNLILILFLFSLFVSLSLSQAPTVSDSKYNSNTRNIRRSIRRSKTKEHQVILRFSQQSRQWWRKTEMLLSNASCHDSNFPIFSSSEESVRYYQQKQALRVVMQASRRDLSLLKNSDLGHLD